MLFKQRNLIFSCALFFFSFQQRKFSQLEHSPKSEKWANEMLSKMTLEEKVAQFFMIATWSNRGAAHQKEIEDLITKHNIGGLIYFQGSREDLKASITKKQSLSKIPLLIGMDAEWGPAMRLTDEERVPYPYTIGAANDSKLSERIGEIIAQECREVGVHINFAPVADVNSNPKNPVIGFRSFGEDADLCAVHTAAMVRGMEKNSILTSVKHFPGHGDTDKDSHYELPTVNHTLEQFRKIDFKPFEAGIAAGTSTIMVGHLNVPALDPSGTPSSLSKKVIKEYLQQELKFKGLVVSDALNMKAVADKYGKTEVVIKAFEAGNDILLYPESVSESITAFVEYVKKGKISQQEIDERCKKVLLFKYKALFPEKDAKTYTAGEKDWARKEVYEKAICLVKNERSTLPIKVNPKNALVVSIGANTSHFSSMLSNSMDFKKVHFYSFEEAIQRLKNKLDSYDVIITTLHPTTVLMTNNFGIRGDVNAYLNIIPASKKHILCHFGNPYNLENLTSLSKIDALALAYENHYAAQDRMAQMLVGSIGTVGKLSTTYSQFFKKENGIELKRSDRLKFSQPEELGISPEKLNEIDEIMRKSIQKGAFPGGQVLLAVEGNIIYNKAFGVKSNSTNDTVTIHDLYDIASVTKIAASTAAVMRLQTQQKFSMDKKLGEYLPELTEGTDFQRILIRDMMAHQAGLPAWIPFFKKPVENKELYDKILSEVKKEGFTTQVAENLHISDEYHKQIYKQILASKLQGKKSYEYSDLGYYFIKKIVEKHSDVSLNQFLNDELYGPMGLRKITYLPLQKFPKSHIAPTEDDQVFRKQVVHGHVHDPGAAMLGGVGGHAGLFSNALDLAAVMQLFLNGGTYAGHRYIDQEVIDEYTQAQFPTTNRRGAGFDRPTKTGKGGPTTHLVSQESFGHTGFTGTMAWVDKKYAINYVFLSNRVHPSADNWKIRDLHVRTDIQRVMYEAVIQSKGRK
jgi:beta-N-acetylhexosaminidase